MSEHYTLVSEKRNERQDGREKKARPFLIIKSIIKRLTLNSLEAVTDKRVVEKKWIIRKWKYFTHHIHRTAQEHLQLQTHSSSQ